MREVRGVRTLRLRLLALVLALALTWYALNPAPGHVRRVKRDEETPDEERRVAGSPAGVGHEPGLAGAAAIRSAVRASSSDAEESIDDLKWPEVIDVK